MADITKQVVSGVIVAVIGAVILLVAGYAWQTLTGGGLIRLLGGVVASDMEAARAEATTEHAGIRADLDEAHAGIRADFDGAIDERLAGRGD